MQWLTDRLLSSGWVLSSTLLVAVLLSSVAATCVVFKTPLHVRLFTTFCCLALASDSVWPCFMMALTPDPLAATEDKTLLRTSRTTWRFACSPVPSGFFSIVVSSTLYRRMMMMSSGRIGTDSVDAEVFAGTWLAASAACTVPVALPATEGTFDERRSFWLADTAPLFFMWDAARCIPLLLPRWRLSCVDFEKRSCTFVPLAPGPEPRGAFL